jgi:hypothetical protein
MPCNLKKRNPTQRLKKPGLSQLPEQPHRPWRLRLGGNILLWKRKAPNPGGGVGRKKRVMRMVPGGKPAPRAMSFG